MNVLPFIDCVREYAESYELNSCTKLFNYIVKGLMDQVVIVKNNYMNNVL